MKILRVLLVVGLFVLWIILVTSCLDYLEQQCAVEAQELGLQHNFQNLKCFVRDNSTKSWISLSYYKQLLFEQEFMDNTDE